MAYSTSKSPTFFRSAGSVSEEGPALNPPPYNRHHHTCPVWTHRRCPGRVDVAMGEPKTCFYRQVTSSMPRAVAEGETVTTATKGTKGIVLGIGVSPPRSSKMRCFGFHFDLHPFKRHRSAAPPRTPPPPHTRARTRARARRTLHSSGHAKTDHAVAGCHLVTFGVSLSPSAPRRTLRSCQK